MPLHIDPQAWNADVKDAYAGVMPHSFLDPGDNHAYFSGRVEGEALHQHSRPLCTGLNYA